jgi:hypothetical protein
VGVANGTPCVDSYETIVRFLATEKARWLKGLLQEAGHHNFVLSGPWSPDGNVPGRFGSALDNYELLLDASGSDLMVRLGPMERKVLSSTMLRRTVPAPVADRFANDLTTHALWSSIRRALTVDDTQARFRPPPTPTH